MNPYLLTAAILTFALGAAHSIVGEILVFRRMARVMPALRSAGLRVRQTNILWASWHLVTAFGWGMAVVLYTLSVAPTSALTTSVATAISCSTLAGAVLVLVGTKGGHPGWVVLLIIAGLTWLA
jgi:hypothetical protein